jgi:3-keto-disaccharide hydrolase
MRAAARILCMLALAITAHAQEVNLGYDDTPMLPTGDWHIHDGHRPQPRVITPAPGAGFAAAPADAIVLLGSGNDTSAFQMADNGADVTWRMRDGVLETGTGYIETKEKFTDFQLHVEFATPGMVRGDSQGRGNSGVYLLGEFEIQVLDSYQNPTYPDGQAAAMYGQHPPMVNASRPPGEWQGYDIFFRAPRFDAQGELTQRALVTVVHNGILVQNAREFWGPTEHRRIDPYVPSNASGPIALQDHGNPVRYRNIWIRPLSDD